MGGVAATAAIALAGGACDGNDPETIVTEAAEEDRPQIVLGEPFEGTATVDEVISPRAFRLFDTLVVTAEPVDVTEGEWTVVSGVVRRWEPEALERRLGVDFTSELEELDDELVVVADRVEPAPEDDVES